MDSLDSIASALGFGSGWGAKAMARALGEGKLKVAALSDPVARALEQAGHEPFLVEPKNGRLPLEDAAVDALCCSGLPPPETAPQLLAEFARVVKSGGRVIVATAGGLARRGPQRPLIAALLLHAGIVDLDQRMSRGVVLSSGRVRR
jgi:SAM-dependent methyltransferase